MMAIADAVRAAGPAYVLGRARVPACVLQGAWQADAEGLALIDIQVAHGRIQAVAPAGALGPGLDLAGRQVWPAFRDLHTHLDKTYTLARAPNGDGTLLGAVKAAMADHARWRPRELDMRADFALRCAWAHGTAALRTHLDAAGPHADMSWGVLRALRERWAGRVDVQMVAMVPLDFYLRDDAPALARRVALDGGLLGGVTRVQGPTPQAARQRLDEALDALMRLARAHGLDIDLHVDESCDPGADTLGAVAQAAGRHGLGERVVCGHCCSLSQQDDALRERTLRACREAGLAVVGLPLVNAYLQDRMAGRTPRLRGLPPLLELAAAGVPVALASDNCGDAFHAYGDYDMLDVVREAVRGAHLDRTIAGWPASVTTTPARLMRADAPARLRPGACADLLVFPARNMAELLARPQSDRMVVRHGAPLQAPLPAFEELDEALTLISEA